MSRPILTSFVEYDNECQAELKLLDSDGDACLYGNISDFWRPEIREVVEQLERKPHLAVSVMLPLMREKRAVMRHAWCQRHGSRCFLKGSRTHMAGSSCTAFSRQGAQRGLSDPNVLHLLSWPLGCRNAGYTTAARTC